MRPDAELEISSLQNRWVKEIRKAMRQGGLTESGYLVAEGLHLLEEAMRSGLEIPLVLAAESAVKQVEGLSGNWTLRPVAARVMQELSGLEHAAGVLALVSPPPEAGKAIAPGKVTLVLDGIQDPGNAGTLLRSAEAFGAAAVIGLKGTVDLFHPKVLRASAGSAFRVPVLRHAVWQDLDVPAGFLVAGAVARGGEPPASLNFREGAVLAVGNEGAGLSAGLRQCSTPVTISTCGVESLNAAVAGSILLYEAWLRR